MAMEEMRQLFGKITFEDLTVDVVREMCKIITLGQRIDYKFRVGPDSCNPDEYIADLPDKTEEPVYLSDLDEELLKRSGLIEIEWIESKKHEDPVGHFYLRPTQKAMHFYERLKQEDLIDKDGYLKKQVS